MMKVKLSKKEIKFLVGVIGPMHEEQFIENINKSLSLRKEEKELIVRYVEESRVSILFKKLNSINEEKNLHYK